MTSIGKPWRAAAIPLLASAILAGCAVGQSAPVGPSTDQIQSARTPGDHTALARRYEREAEGARARAADHERMAKAYGPVETHCRDLAKTYESLASQYDGLQSYHRVLAERAAAR